MHISFYIGHYMNQLLHAYEKNAVVKMYRLHTSKNIENMLPIVYLS